MANSVNWIDLLDDVHADLPGCPRALVIQKVREIVIDFCKHTQAWQFQMDPISIVADQQDYDLLTQPNCAVIDTVLEVRWSTTEAASVVRAGRPLKPVRDFLVTSRKDTIRLVRTPSQTITAAGDTKGLLVKVALKPDRDSDGADDEGFDRIWEDWRDAFMMGAKGLLQVMPRQTWTDEKNGEKNRDRYLRERTKARIEVSRNSLNVGLRAHSPNQVVDNIRGHAGFAI